MLQMSMVLMILRPYPPHFESLLNNVTTDANMQNVKECVQNTEYLYYGNNLLITPYMVQNAIDKLKSGKACGNDGVSAEHFIHSDRRITILLSIFFYNKAISHGIYLMML